MSDPGGLLPRCALAGDVLTVAPSLLGATVETGAGQDLVVVRLTEVEAYAGPGDPGSHAARGRTPRTAVMFGPPGHLYVYFSYGMHWCANLVTGPDGSASAVLLRAGEVVAGHETARRRRPAARVDRDLARGPARLAAALGLDGALSGVDVCSRDAALRVRRGRPAPAAAVRTGARVGVAGAGGDVERHPWRFWLDGESSVSAYRPATPRARRRG